MTQSITNASLLDIAPPKARVMKHLRSWIDRGTLSGGEPLPSERALAEKLDVARGTVRSALEELVRQGVISDGNGRRRVVQKMSNGRSTATGLMARTLGVVTGREHVITDRLTAPGFELFIERGAFDAVFDAGLHGIKLYPDALRGDGVDHLIESRPMGVVFGRFPGDPEVGQAMVQAVADAGIPVVLYGDTPFNDGFDRVMSDHEHGTYELTRWLIGQGRRRIVRVWTDQRRHDRWLQARDRGYRRACDEAGVEPVEPIWLPAGVEHSLGQRDRFEQNVRWIGGYLIEHVVRGDAADALMMISDSDVYPAAAACRLFGRTPNQDVLIVGYDNYWPNLTDRQFEPITPAATVDKLNLTLGQELVKLLIERVEGKLPEGPQARVIEPQLIVPESPFHPVTEVKT